MLVLARVRFCRVFACETSPCLSAPFLLQFSLMERTQWHPATVQAFGNELEDCRKDLAIEAEVQLTVRLKYVA